MAAPGAAIAALAPWQTFYEIVGSSAGALTGLQFVVMALVAQARAARSMHEIRAFGTPTVVHFCAALLVAAVGAAPWPALIGAAIAFGICGAAGAVYALLVMRHARVQTGYAPDAGDWTWYVGFPLLAYLSLVAGAKMLLWYTEPALFVIGGATILLLFVGIHNSWDTVTYVAIKHWGAARDQDDVRK